MSMTEPTIRRKYRDFGHYIVETDEHTGRETYVFHPIDDDRFDYPVVFVGETTINNYPDEQDPSDMPEIVLDALDDIGVTLITGVDAGWSNWEGRPEWSDTYVDSSEAAVFSDN